MSPEFTREGKAAVRNSEFSVAEDGQAFPEHKMHSYFP